MPELRKASATLHFYKPQRRRSPLFEAKIKVGFTPDEKLWSTVVVQVFPPDRTSDRQGVIFKLQNGFAASFTLLPVQDLQNIAALILEAVPQIEIALQKQLSFSQALKEFEAKAFEFSQQPPDPVL